MGRNGVIAVLSDPFLYIRGGSGDNADSAAAASVSSALPPPTDDKERLAAIMKEGILNSRHTQNTVNTGNAENTAQVIDPAALSVSLQKQALLLTDKYSNSDGSRVNYMRMRESVEFEEYRRLSVLLQDCDIQGLAGMSVQMRISFFVNL